MVIACLALYAPSLRDYFVLDDFIWLHAAQVSDPAAFLRNATSFPDATAYSVPTPFWRPLIDLYFFVAWRLFGMNPVPYHLINVVVHALNALLIAVFVRQLTGSRAAAYLTALLWVILPSYDYAVVWISEATELLATFWYLLTLVLYVAFLRSERGRWWYYAAAVLCLAPALLAKQSSVTILAALIMLAPLTMPSHRWSEVRRTGLSLLPFVAICAAFVWFHYQHDYRMSARAGIYEIGPHALANGWDYLLRLAWPFVTPGYHETSAASRVAAVVLLVLGGLSILLRRGVLSFAFLWLLIALIPYSFFPAGTESRYLYVAAVPYTLLLVLAVRQVLLWIRPVPWRILVGGAAALAVLPLCLLLGRETRERQTWLHQQSEAYRQMVIEIPHLCGPLPDGGRIAVVGGPMLDLFGESTRMALNLHYPRVQVERVDAIAVVAQPVNCLVRYEAGGYERVHSQQAGSLDP